jgi:signal transduction histidine kinase/AraC-like DNA-binding protein/ActR/RegA family two-component response regulator
VATKKGIARLNPDGMTYKFYDDRDGLDNHSFNPRAFFRSPHSGMIYAGGRNGLSVFAPGSIQDNPFTPPVWITGLRKYASRKGKPTETAVKGMAGRPKIELSHWENIMAFELTSLNFRNPEKNQFAYRLIGFNDNWINIGTQRELTFTNLDAGAYTLQVKAGNNDGVWNETPTELTIVVHPPWWKTWWAYALYGFFFFTVFYLLRRYELNRQRLAFNLDAEKAEAARLMELDDFKTRLYTNLTHEFRTPLTVILGLADQIDQPSGIREVLRRNAKGLLRLVNQILDLAKLEAGQLKLDLALTDIVPYMQYLTESYQSYAAGKQINLVAYMETERLLMDIDEEKLHSVVANLLSNAIKFTPQGGKVILHLREEGGTLLLKVRDNGIGIAAGQLPRIFDRFYQVDGTATRAAEGTGLGLALTKELVELMGGQISVSSQEGKGTEFTVALPITRQAPPAQEHRTGLVAPAPLPDRPMAQSVRRPAGGSTGLPQLLLIEDNEDVAFYIQSCLEGRFALTLAPNGALGIAEALESIPDLIISDVMMPEKDGFELCDTLKHDERTSHIPIILLTAKADAASKISGLRRGADAYLTKPFDKEELLVRLEMLLERQKRMAAYFAQPGAAGLPVDEPALEAPLAPEIIAVEDAFLQKVCAIVEEHYADEDFALPQLCQKVGMSRSQLFRKMKALIDESPSDFIRNYRLNEAKRLLETTDLNISEVAWAVGYKDVSHFSKSFQEAFGMPPSATDK